MEDYLRCIVCEELFNEEERVPRILRCGHTICGQCLIQLDQQHEAASCPSCRNPIGNLADVSKNFQLIALLANRNERANSTSLENIEKISCIFDEHAAVNDNGMNDLVQTLRDASQVSVLSVMGTVRVGKSWFCSYFTQRERLFQSQGGLRSCTRGANAFAGATLSDLYRRHDLDIPITPASEWRAVVVDLEGKGQEGLDHDYRLLLPVLLASRSIVYLAQQGAIGRHVFLEEAAVCITLADKVYQSTRGTRPFGDLHLVVNSVTGDLQDAEAEIKGWLEDEEPRGRQLDEKTRIQRHNEIRQTIRESFASVSVHALPPISGDPTWVHQASGPFNGVSNDYKTAINHVIEDVLTDLQQSHMVAASETIISAATLPPLLRQLSVAAAEGAVDVPSVADAVDRQICNAALDRCIQETRDCYAALSSKVETLLETAGSVAVDLELLDGEIKAEESRRYDGFREELQRTMVSGFAQDLALRTLNGRLREIALSTMQNLAKQTESVARKEAHAKELSEEREKREEEERLRKEAEARTADAEKRKSEAEKMVRETESAIQKAKAREEEEIKQRKEAENRHRMLQNQYNHMLRQRPCTESQRRKRSKCLIM